MKNLLLTFCLLCLSLNAVGQEADTFFVQAPKNEVEVGALFEVEFVIKNLQGEFQMPDVSPFQIVGGPMQSSSFQSINGSVTQEYRYKYYFKCEEEGIFFIPEAELTTDRGKRYTEPLEIAVLPKGSSPSPRSLKEILKEKKTKKF